MRIISLLILLIVLVGCGQQTSTDTLTIGTISGPETELVKVAQKIAKKQYNLNIKIVEFNDYNLPNEALKDGSIDANVFQHLAYLQAASKAHNYAFQVIGKTFIYPMGIYSEKIKSINELPDNATIAIPNDPSNETRALLLLQQANLIQLATNEQESLSPMNVTANPKHLKITTLDAAQLPRVLSDVTVAIINTTYAIPAGLNPAHDAIYMENKNSPYANLIVIRNDSQKKAQLNKFVQVMHSSLVQQKAKELFNDAAIPAW